MTQREGEQRDAIGKVLVLMTNKSANDEGGAPGGASTPPSGAPERRAG
jgi:hypothetical protein